MASASKGPQAAGLRLTSQASVPPTALKGVRAAVTFAIAALAAALVSLSVGASGGVPAALAAPPIELQPVATQLIQPVFVAAPPGDRDRLFVVEQTGVIKVFEAGEAAPRVFLDISDRVLLGPQQGLVGLAFHPQYAVNGRFFVDYTRRSDQATVIAEYRVSPDGRVADPLERILLVIVEPLPNLAGGTLAFGPDGYLYIGVGNAGVADDPKNTAQDLGQLLGKILRIDVDRAAPGGLPYSVPASNPFAGSAPGRDEIFAYGVRNPWRLSFDRLTGDLYAGDVGNSAREEVNLIRSGGNYGWRIREGTICSGYVPERCDAPGFIEPLVDYPHDGVRCAVVGGHVYRGSRGTLPSGTYVFGDFCSGEIFALEGGTMRTLLATSLVISSFGEDADGELYVVDWRGTVYRIVGTGDTSASARLHAAILPTSRSVAVGGVATAFATIAWPGPEAATACEIAPLDPVPPGEFTYQTTDPATNELVGEPNTPVDIAAGGHQTFVVSFRPARPFAMRELRLAYRCANAPAAAIIPGLNTLSVFAGAEPTADIIAVAATASGDGIVTLSGPIGIGAFAVATSNIGAAATLIVSADDGGAGLPIETFVCETTAGTGACAAPPAPSLALDVASGARPTLAVFVIAGGPIALDPAYHRVFVRFDDDTGAARGSTSVAVRSP